MSDKQVIEQRIYIGNVDFKATEDDLRKHFEGLNVTDVDIPTKTKIRNKKTHTKHLGFAFVEFATKEDADKAVEKFNREAFLGRDITIKKAVPPASEEEKEKKKEAYRAHKSELEKKKADKKKKKEVNVKKAEAKSEVEEKDEDSKEISEKSKDENENMLAKNKKPKTKKPKKKKPAKVNEPVQEKETASEEQTASKTTESPKAKQESEQPKEVKIPEGKASDDTIFITNLDYRVGVKTLNDIFRDLKPKWIHVPTKISPSYHSNGPRRVLNKGIAFVKFSSHELQQKAIKEFNDKTIRGRKIFVDIAIDARSIDASENEASSPAPVESSE